MSGVQANLLLAGVQNASPWLSTDELQAPAKLAMAQQRNALLNRMDEQNLQAQDMEMIARASAYLESLPDTAARQAAYPGIVSQLQGAGFAKNAPSVYPGDERISQLARMGTPSKELLTIAENRRFAQSQNPPVTTGTGTTAAPGAPATSGTYEGAIGGHEGTGQNPRSTAYGTGQFLESTWLNFAAEHPEMFPNMSQQQILAARSNPALGNTAINWLAQKNAADLQASGVAPSGQSLGIAHYLGSGAAAKIMQAGDAEPVRNFVSEAAVRANPELANMTVGQMKSRYAGTPNPSFMTASTPQPPPAPYQTASLTPTAPPGATPGAPAQPAATTTAQGTTPAQPAPAATTTALPAAPALPALGSDGLTDQQRQQNAALFATGRVSPADQVKLKQEQAQQNYTRQEKALADYRADVGQRLQIAQYQLSVAGNQLQVEAAQRDVQRLQQQAQAAEDAHAKAVREAAEAARTAKLPFQGTADTAQLRNILLTGDPRSPEYHAAYEAYATPHVGEGGLIIKPGMLSFRLPIDADGNPVTTYDQSHITIGPGSLTELRKLETQASALTAALDDFASTAKNAGVGERLATIAGAPTDLRSAWTNAGLMAKGQALFDLGVLSGPDMTVIRGALADPSTLMGATASTDTIDKQVGRIKRLLETRIDQARRSYGGGMSAGGTPAPAAAAPAPSKVIRYDANGNRVE